MEYTRNAVDAAARMEQHVRAEGNPNQDNFTCVILDCEAVKTTKDEELRDDADKKSGAIRSAGNNTV